MAVGAYTMALLMTHTAGNFVLELGSSGRRGRSRGHRARAPRDPAERPVSRRHDPVVRTRRAIHRGQVATDLRRRPGPHDERARPRRARSEPRSGWHRSSCLAALIVMVLVANLLWSRYGRSFRAVRDDEIAASLAGIHVARTKVMAFTISAACAGLGGALLEPLDRGREHRRVPACALDLAARRDGTGWHRARSSAWSWGGILLVYLPQWSTSLSVGLQPRQRGERLPGHHHLRRWC